MASNDSKRYYWLKLKKDFFQSHKLKVLKALPNGRLYALIYLELLAESTSHEGKLRFSEMLPYDAVTLAAVIDEDSDNVSKAIEVLSNLELLEVLDDKTIYMLDIQAMIGSETGVAERVRRFREKENMKLLQCNDDVTQKYQKCNLEYRDKSIEIRDKNNKKDIRKKFIKPTLEELTQYASENNLNIDANRFMDYYESNGWKVGKNPMKDWKATARNWARKDQPRKGDELPIYEDFVEL